MFFLGGLVSVAFGVVLFARPGMGAISLALLFGLFNLISGAGCSSRHRAAPGPPHSALAGRRAAAAAATS